MPSVTGKVAIVTGAGRVLGAESRSLMVARARKSSSHRAKATVDEVVGEIANAGGTALG